MLYIDDYLLKAYDYMLSRMAHGNSYTTALDITSSQFSIDQKDLAELYHCFN